MNTLANIILNRLNPIEQLLIVSSDSSPLWQIIQQNMPSLNITFIDYINNPAALTTLQPQHYQGAILNNIHHWLMSPDDLKTIKSYLAPSAQCFASFFNYQYIGTIHDLVQKGAQDLFFKYEKHTYFPTTLSLVWSFFFFLNFTFEEISCLVSAEFEPLKQQLPCQYQRHQLQFELHHPMQLLQLFTYAYLFEMTTAFPSSQQIYSELSYQCYPIQQHDFKSIHHGK